MIAVNIEWIGTLCAILIFTCDFQFITTVILAFSIPDVLWLTRSHLATSAGLLASLIALPTALRLKTAHMSPNLDRIYGYTLCYQRLAISVCMAFHLLAIILAIIALVLSSTMCKDLKKIMKSYHTKQSSKILVDNIQYVLQCCGAFDYEDWYQIDWAGNQRVSETHKSIRSLEPLLQQDTDIYPDLALIRMDSVPYSCCSRSALKTCIHQNILQLGPSTINTHGCEKKVEHATGWLLFCEFILYGVSLTLELAILLLLKQQPNYKKPKNISCH